MPVTQKGRGRRATARQARRQARFVPHNPNCASTCLPSPHHILPAGWREGGQAVGQPPQEDQLPAGQARWGGGGRCLRCEWMSPRLLHGRMLFYAAAGVDVCLPRALCFAHAEAAPATRRIPCPPLLLPADKHEHGAIGGTWDPSDGGHPASDPAALTRTAARHFKAATGVDLSGCTQVCRPGVRLVGWEQGGQRQTRMLLPRPPPRRLTYKVPKRGHSTINPPASAPLPPRPPVASLLRGALPAPREQQPRHARPR